MKHAYADIPAVRIASTPEEVTEIQELRYQIYGSEMGLAIPGVNHANHVIEDSLDPVAVHLYVKTQARLAGAVRLNRDCAPAELEAHLQVDGLPRPFVYCSRLCVAKECRGSSVVRSLVRASFEEFRKLGAAAAICHCYPHLLNFYLRLGFHPYGVSFQAPGLEYLGEQTPLRILLNTQNRYAA